MQVCRRASPRPEAPVALTIGNFDGVHLGHQAMLARVKQVAAELNIASCVMTFEPHPRELLTPHYAPTRLTSLREKLELLAESGIDRVQICRFNHDFAKIDTESFITRILQQELAVHWLLVGEDFRFGARRAGDVALLKEFSQRSGSFEVEIMPSFSVNGLRVSSTAIREALANGNLNLAQQLLGRPYSISGRVVNGDKLGKQIGFPTANIQLKHNRPPLMGIFVVEITSTTNSSLPAKMHGVASLGIRPTTHAQSKPVLEVHLFDFCKEIYGHHLRVHFLHKLRDEEKYPDLITLARQIARDAEDAKAYFMTQADLVTQQKNGSTFHD